MSKSTPSGNTTVTQTNNSQPWSGQQPYLLNLFQQAGQNYRDNPISYYPGQTVAPMPGQETNALNATYQRGMYGSPVTNAAQQSAYNTLNGSYLSAGNPYFSNMMQSVYNQVNPMIASGFEAGGRLGSGAQANAFESAMTQEGGNLAFQNFANERSNQLKAGLTAPELAGTDLSNLGAAYGAANSMRGNTQGYINEDMSRYQFNQQAPFQRLAQYSQLIGNPVGFSTNSSTSTPYFTNPLGSALGMGIGGLSLYNGLNSAAGGSLLGDIGSMGGKGASAAGYAVPAASILLGL